MKLSYSTRGWAGKDWFDFCAAAASTGVQGVEIDSVRSPAFCQRTSPTNPELAVSAKRRMVQQGLDIPCVGTAADFTDAAAADEIFDAIRAAGDLLVPYVTVFTVSRDLDVITAALAPYLEAAEAAGLVLLVETAGGMADTERLRDVLNHFASDHLAACWNMFDTYFFAGESAEKTITNLGAYVRHVRITDGVPEEGTPYFTNELVGEGRLPIQDMVNALRSVNYDGQSSAA